MAYCTSADIDGKYGNGNRVKWADMEGLGSSNPLIATRTTEAITYASDLIDDHLRGSKFSFITPITATTPSTLKNVCRKIAAYELSTARGVTAYTKDGQPITPLYADYMDAMNTLEKIINQTIVLNLDT